MIESTSLPLLDEQGLKNALVDAYPSHKNIRNSFNDLVTEYMKLWRLIRSFPDRRIVGTGPIIAVWRIHTDMREQYRKDCIDYFGDFLWWKDAAWGGKTDICGTVDTCRIYEGTYDKLPPAPWHDMVRLYKKQGRLNLVVSN